MAIEDINIPAEIAGQITRGLGAVGIQLPLFVAQAFLLVLSLAAFAFGAARVRREGIKDLPGLLTIVAFGLLSLGVLYAWGEGLLRPLGGELSGRIDRPDRDDVERYQGMRVQLLDFSGQKISLGIGLLDDRDGRFSLSYAPAFSDPPRTLRITAPGCKTEDRKLRRSDLMRGEGITYTYRCQ